MNYHCPAVDPNEPPLQKRWRQARAQASARWPEVAFRETPDPDWAGAFERVAEPRAPCLEDWCLVRAALDGDPEARRLLEAHLSGPLERWLATQHPPEPLRAEVLQHTRLGLWGYAGRMGKLHEYDARGPIGPWLRVVGVRLGVQALREAGVLGRDGAGPEAPTLTLLRPEHRPTFKAVLERALSRLGDRDRLLLGLRFAQAQPLEVAARAYRVERDTAEQWLAGARAALDTAVHEELRGTFFADEDIRELTDWLAKDPESGWMRLFGLRG